MFFLNNTRHIQTSHIQSILLRLPNWLGDSVMVSPAFECLKKSFTKASFTLVGTNVSCRIYERDKRVRAIFIDDTKTANCRITATKALAKEIGTHDLAISFSNTFFSALLLYWSKTPLRIGYGKNARSFLLTHTVPLCKNKRHRTHQVHLYLRLIATLSQVQDYALKAVCSDTDSITSVDFTESAESSISRTKSPQETILSFFNAQPLALISSPITLSPHKIAIGINPGAAFGSAKCWEKAYFIDIIKHFLSQDFDVYLFGSSDQSRADIDFRDSIAKHHNARLFHDLTDKTTITQLIDYIAAMHIFITNDSGPMHIAAALNVPMIAIFGPTSIDETSPYDSRFYDGHHGFSTLPDGTLYHANHRWVLLHKQVPCAPCKKRECPLKHHRCMTLITPQEVITHTMNLLESHYKRLNNDT